MADIPRSNPNDSAKSPDEQAIAGSGSYSVELPGTSIPEGAASLEPELGVNSEPAAIEAGATQVMNQADKPGTEDSVPGGDKGQENTTEAGSRPKRGCGLRSLLWLSLLITLPFLGLNGLAAWQVHSLTHYSKAKPNSPPTFAQPTLQRFSSLLFGVKVPRPENTYSPTDLGLTVDSHRIDLGNGEFLDGWYVPGPKASPQAQADPKPDSEAANADKPNADGEELPADAPASVAPVEPAAAAVETDGEAASVEVLSAPTQASDKKGVVLVFPAYAASKQTLLQEIKLLHLVGYATFAVDPRGVGDSSGNDTTLGRREAEDVAAAVDYVKETFENPPIALYGRIMGASYVMRAIVEFDLQPDALILEDPYAQLFTLTESVVESVGLPRSPTTQMLTLWGGLLRGGDPAALDPITYASKITTPTLVLYGSDASWVSLDEVLGIHSQLQGPKEILGLSSVRDAPVSTTAVGPWIGKVESFLDGNMGQ